MAMAKECEGGRHERGDPREKKMYEREREDKAKVKLGAMLW